WLGQTQREFDEYDIIFTERVSGLSVGAQVRFNGIQKGEVDTLTIDPDDPSIVIARIRVGKDTPVRVDTTAELEPVGFTGLLIIQLVGGSANKPLLKDTSEDKVPQIKADESTIGQFLEGSGDVLAKAQHLLSDHNIQSVSSILSNVETLTAAFADNTRKLLRPCATSMRLRQTLLKPQPSSMQRRQRCRLFLKMTLRRLWKIWISCWWNPMRWLRIFAVLRVRTGYL
ncbi:MAG: MCE family protein, partial [Marinicaulis sp.]|nr:MCE family protein [Marinicaulis sp.]